MALTIGLFHSAQAADIAPYFYTWGLGKVNSLTEAKRLAGVTSATYAFVVSDNNTCAPSNDIVDAMNDVRSFNSGGGNVIIGFGGASGPYLEAVSSQDFRRSIRTYMSL